MGRNLETLKMNTNKIFRKIFGAFRIGDSVQVRYHHGRDGFLYGQIGTIIKKMETYEGKEYYLIGFGKLPEDLTVFSLRKEWLELL